MVCSPPGSSAHGDSPGKNVGVGCCALLHSGDEGLSKDVCGVGHGLKQRILVITIIEGEALKEEARDDQRENVLQSPGEL